MWTDVAVHIMLITSCLRYIWISLAIKKLQPTKINHYVFPIDGCIRWQIMLFLHLDNRELCAALSYLWFNACLCLLGERNIWWQAALSKPWVVSAGILFRLNMPQQPLPTGHGQRGETWGSKSPKCTLCSLAAAQYVHRCPQGDNRRLLRYAS